MSELKKYVVIDYDGMSGNISFNFFETDINEDDELFNEIEDNYSGNCSNTIVVEFEKFKEAILEITKQNASLLIESIKFDKVIRKGLDDFEIIEE
jgi:hypothetical protein